MTVQLFLQVAILLIDVLVADLFGTLLDDHGDVQEQKEVKTNYAKGGCKDDIEVLIGEAAEGSNAAAQIGRHDCIRACGVSDERR